MPSYHARFFNLGGHVFSHEDFMAESDRQAIDYAYERFRSGIGAGHEIWRGEHHVHTERYPPPGPLRTW